MTLIPKNTQETLLTHNNYVVGLSGGVDSVVALYCMKQIVENQQGESSLRAIHINHGLSDNADYWEEFCQATCDEYGVDLTIIKVELDGTKNIEANARQARYTAIRENLSNEECLVTGHHEDDQAETILLALKRGSGLDGLCAMAPFSVVNGIPIHRPLLSVGRDEIEEYARNLNIEWIEDDSNTDTSFDRNFLRHEILPLLKERWPSFTKTAGRSAQMCQSSREVTENFAESYVDRAIELGFIYRNEIEHKSSSYKFYILREWFKRSEVKPQSLARMKEIERAVINSRHTAKPKLQLDKDKWLVRIGDKIYIHREE